MDAAVVNVSRARALDGLRGFAAAAVIYYHAILHCDLSLINRVLSPPIQSAASPSDLIAKVLLTIFNGESAVFMFFVLSGFVLHSSLQRITNTSLMRGCFSFIFSRIIRLYPPVICCMFTYYALSIIWSYSGVSGFPLFTFKQALMNSSLIDITMHGPSTTIQSEILAIPFLIATFIISRLFGFTGLACCFIYSIMSLDLNWMVLWLPNMHAYLIAFIAGMVAADPRVRALFASAPPSAALLSLSVFWFLRAVEPGASLPGLIGMVSAAAVLVCNIYVPKDDVLHRILESKLAQFLGRISFSIYLYNVPVLVAIWAFTDKISLQSLHPLRTGMVVGTLALLVTIPIARLSEYLIETPSIRVGHYASHLIRTFAYSQRKTARVNQSESATFT